MRQLAVNISEADYNKYNLMQNGNITFNELEELITIEYAKKALQNCNTIAINNGLDTLTLAEINDEINAVRSGKSNN